MRSPGNSDHALRPRSDRHILHCGSLSATLRGECSLVAASQSGRARHPAGLAVMGGMVTRLKAFVDACPASAIALSMWGLIVAPSEAAGFAANVEIADVETRANIHADLLADLE